MKAGVPVGVACSLELDQPEVEHLDEIEGGPGPLTTTFAGLRSR